MLAEAVRTGVSARAVGRATGAKLQPSSDGGLETLRAEAARLGFKPTTRRRGDLHEIVLNECPFADLAVDQPEAVCELHVGVAEGIAVRAGGL